MARMHSRRKGRHGSTKPVRDSKPSWVKYKPKEVVQLVEKLGKKGMQSAEIGRELRDSYGIPSVKTITGKKISSILKEAKVYPKFPEDLLNLMKSAVNVYKHLEKNKKDLHSKRGFQLMESKIKRLVKYYKNKGVIDRTWKYSIDVAKLLVE
jgi:small subunit ribosomal protein S15